MSAANSHHAALQGLIEHLEHRSARGEERIWLSPEAKAALAKLPSLFHTQPKTVAEPVTPKRTPQEQRPMKVAETASPTAEAAPAQPISAAAEAEALIPLGNTKAEKLAWLKQKAADWAPAKSLDSLRDTMVFAVGNPDADLMFVGEAPGGEEERKREPFVGPAGQLLTKIIQAMGIQREDVYISNIVKFRPALPNQRESNRKPTAQEMASCLPFVLAEVEVVQPKVIVALGGTAMEGLLKLEKASVGQARGRFHDLQGTPLLVTYHPSYLLHNPDIRERRKVWEDMMVVMERLGMPISEKQRRFFQK